MSWCSERGIAHSEYLAWQVEDRAKQMAWLISQGETCQLCGTAEWEWNENRFAYSPVEHLCHGCYLKEVASEGAGKMPGTTIDLVPWNEQDNAKRLLMERKRAEARRKERAEEVDDGQQPDGQRQPDRQHRPVPAVDGRGKRVHAEGT